MAKVPKIISIILIVAGGVMIVVGGVTYYLVHRELSDENIVVSDDATNFAGEPVEGPFTAYSQATVIKKHTEELSGGKTYAELDREDPLRATVMDSSFLRASLFTSVVAFGVAALVGALGLLFILIGIAMLAIDKRLLAPATVSETDPAPEPVPVEPIPSDPAPAI